MIAEPVERVRDAGPVREVRRVRTPCEIGLWIDVLKNLEGTLRLICPRRSSRIGKWKTGCSWRELGALEREAEHLIVASVTASDGDLKRQPLNAIEMTRRDIEGVRE